LCVPHRAITRAWSRSTRALPAIAAPGHHRTGARSAGG
jgi:hypothetical protein